jgi:hypothetical protein
MFDDTDDAEKDSRTEAIISVDKVVSTKANEILAAFDLASFLVPPILKTFWEGQIDWWVAWRGDTPICVWPICVRNKIGFIPELTYWVGPAWLRNLKTTSSLSIRDRVYSTFLGVFSKNYHAIEFELSPEEIDVRSFDWYGNHDRLGRVEILPRYSARLDLSGIDSLENLLPSYSQLRRRETKRLRNQEKDWRIVSGIDTKDALDLYSSTLVNQGSNLRSSLERAIISFTKAKESDYSTFLCAQNINSGTVAGLVGLVTNNYAANLVLNLMRTDSRNGLLMTDLINAAISDSIKRGTRFFDFNGANSPNRAQHKHSFGAKEVLFFRIKISW